MASLYDHLVGASDEGARPRSAAGTPPEDQVARWFRCRATQTDRGVYLSPPIDEETTVLTSADLATAFERNRRIVHDHASGLTHADSLIQPPFRANCLNWVIGHLVVHRDKALTALGSPRVLTDTSVDRYQKESEPILADGPDVMKLEALLADLDQTQDLITSALLSVTDDDLAAEVGSGTRTMPLYKRLHFLYFHDTYHTGQTEPLRQLTGIDDKVI